MLREKRSAIIKYVRDNSIYLENNFIVYDMFRGNLLPYVKDVLKKSLSPQYFEKIEHRLVVINILERYIKKVSVAYENHPSRIADTPENQKILDYYIDAFAMNKKGRVADQYSHLFKGYAFEPFFDDRPKLRVLPYDRFLPYSDNQVDPTSETVFIKTMGKKYINGKDLNVYYAFTKDEIDAFTEDGETYYPALEGNDGINPYNEIHFTYGNRAENELLPVQDTDIIAMSKLISVLLSDLSGANLFQCFSVLYGIDVDFENAVWSPNALWSIKSDDNKKPEVGVIKPTVDTTEVMNFVVSVFVMWLETKGVRVGSIGSIDSGNMASGISKIIDEMDVYKVVKDSISFFESDEKEFWQKMINVHNNWIDNGYIKGLGKLPDTFMVDIKFPEPQPQRQKADLIAEKKLEVDSGFKSKRKAIKELNPDMTDADLELELAEIENESLVEVPFNGQV